MALQSGSRLIPLSIGIASRRVTRLLLQLRLVSIQDEFERLRIVSAREKLDGITWFGNSTLTVFPDLVIPSNDIAHPGNLSAHSDSSGTARETRYQTKN